MSDQELETVKKEIADVSSFVREHMAPVHEERVRLKEAVEGVVQATKDLRRKSVLAEAGDRARVEKTLRYRDFDALDLAIVRSLYRAAKANGSGPRLEEWGVHLRAAMDSLTAASGDELVATAEASQLWKDVNLETMVASQFSRISMPTNPFDIPLQLGDVQWYPGEENVAAKSTALTTAKQTLTAHEMVAEVP